MTTDAAAIKSKNDIVQYIKQHVDLEKHGDVWQGLCPFHAETVASFTVYPGTQTFTCFGCKESGDLIAFVMKFHGVLFGVAMKMLGGDGTSVTAQGVNGKSALLTAPTALAAPLASIGGKSPVDAIVAIPALASKSVAPTLKPATATPKREAYTDIADYCTRHLKVLPAVLERAGAKDTTFNSAPAILFPHEDSIDRVRCLSGTGSKWQPTRSTGGVRCLYGFDRALNLRALPDNTHPLVLCNGQTSVIVAQDQLIPAFCQTDGETPTGLQEPLLARVKTALAEDKRIILAYDNDDAGRAMSDAVKAQLYGYEVSVVRFGGHKGFDLADFCAMHKGKSYTLLRALAATVDATARPIVSLPEMCSDFDRFLNGDRARVLAGEMVELPFKRLHKFGGFAALTSPGKMGAVYGESGGGKTSLLETFTDAMLIEGYDVLWYSPEWGEYENHWRRIQRYDGATYAELRQHQRWLSLYHRGETTQKRSPLDNEVLGKTIQINNDIAKWRGRVHCFQSARWTEDILSRMSERLLDLRTQGRRVAWVVLDYIQLMRSTQSEDSRTAYETILNIVKDWSIEHNVFVWVGVQVLKEVARLKDNKVLIGKYDAQWVRPDPFNLILSVNRMRAPSQFEQFDTQYLPEAHINVAKNSDGEEGALPVMTDFKHLRWVDQPWPPGIVG